MQVDVLVPAGADHGVPVHGDHAEVVRVLPQYLQLSHVRGAQLARTVLDLHRYRYRCVDNGCVDIYIHTVTRSGVN